MNLTPEALARAKAFISEQARPLEQRLYLYRCEGGAAGDVLGALAEFQNEEGGFGHGLEPDVRLADSSVIATTVALQILRDLGVGSEHQMVQRTMRYLLDTYAAEHKVWPIAPPNVDDAPHAPWWSGGSLADSFGSYMANPRAEIVGYLWDYSELAPDALREELTAAVLSWLHEQADTVEMHDLLCYARLAETRSLPDDLRRQMLDVLMKVADRAVTKEPSAWSGYCLKPLTLATSPASPFAEVLADAIELNLDYEIERQQADGSWAPNWTWGDAFPETWEVAKREWSGVLTLATLRTLSSFGRVAGSQAS